MGSVHGLKWYQTHLGWEALVNSGLTLALLFFYEVLFGHSD